MAVDTAAKRNSARHFMQTGLTPILPDGTIAQADRQSSVHSYGGILSATLTAGTASSVSSNVWFFFIDYE